MHDTESPSPGTVGEETRHYMVFSNGTANLALSTDPLTDALTAFRAGQCRWVDLVLRLADPRVIHEDHTAPFWRQMRIYPNAATFIQLSELEVTFSGDAFDVNADGNEATTRYSCTVTLQIENRPPGSRIGELTLTTTGGTT
jgi:hypothetical protein